MGAGAFQWGATNYPAGATHVGINNPSDPAEWAKQPDELGHYVSTAPSDSTATAWFQIPISDDYRYLINLFTELTNPGGIGPSGSGEVGLAVYIDGISAASPGTKLVEGWGTVTFSGGSSVGFSISDYLAGPGPHTIYLVVEWYDYPAGPIVGVDFLADPQLAHFSTDQGVWAGSDDVVTVTVENGVGPFSVTIDWQDGDIQTVNFPRDPSYTTVHSVTHTYAAYDYTDFPSGIPYQILFPSAVDDGTGDVDFIDEINLPVPDLASMSAFLTGTGRAPASAEMLWQDFSFFTPIYDPTLDVSYVTIIDWDDGEIDTLPQADINPSGLNTRSHTYLRRNSYSPTIKLLMSNGWFQHFAAGPLVVAGTYTRSFPRDDGLGMSVQRSFPPPVNSLRSYPVLP